MLAVVAMTGSGFTGVDRLDRLPHVRQDRYRQNGPDTALRERPVPDARLAGLLEAATLSVNYGAQCFRDLGFPVTGHFYGEDIHLRLAASLIAISWELNASHDLPRLRRVRMVPIAKLKSCTCGAAPAASPPVPSDPFEADEVIAALHREDEKLPKPQELIASACDFAERPLAGQRKFAEDVPKATAQVLAGQDDILAKKNGSAAK